MAFFSSFIDKTIGKYAKEVGSALTNKDNLGLNLVTAGAYGVYKGSLSTAKQAAQDYQYRNGGKTQQENTDMLNAQAAKAEQEQADLRFGKSSRLAGLSYGLSSGGSNTQSLINQTQKKKSILGNF